MAKDAIAVQTEGAVQKHYAWEAQESLVRMFDEAAAMCDSGDSDAAVALAVQVLTAGDDKDAEGIWGERTLPSTKAMIGSTIDIVGYRWAPSTFQESDAGLPYFQILECVTREGEPYAVASGGLLAMAQVHAHFKAGFPRPLTVKIVGRKTPAGYTAINLKRV